MARPDLLDVLPFSDYADDDGNRLPMGDGRVAAADLRPGDRFAWPVSNLRGKHTLRTYTVTGHATSRGLPYVTVRSTVQGDGSFAYTDIPDGVELLP